jgi:hypothetical protein
MRIIITESQSKILKEFFPLVAKDKIENIVNKKFDISNTFNPEVEKLQEFLNKQGFDLGGYGQNEDGVDGKYGPYTAKAHKLYLQGKTPKEFKDVVSNISDVIFVGGLEKDMGLQGQTRLLQKGLGSDVKIKSFHYSDSDSNINDYIDKNPNIPIFLFSAGANKIFSISDNSNANLKKVYIIEPYSASPRVIKKIESAVSKGLPRKNVFHGGSPGRGSNIKGATSSNATGHFNALTTVPQLV